MKNFIKYAAIGFAGYLIGFYEMKYNLVKAIAVHKLESESKEKEEESE